MTNGEVGLSSVLMRNFGCPTSLGNRVALIKTSLHDQIDDAGPTPHRSCQACIPVQLDCLSAFLFFPVLKAVMSNRKLIKAKNKQTKKDKSISL